jgi:hypothetical protein
LPGTVSFFVDADSSFDTWTRAPNASQQQWMREHYSRMQAYSSYFDDRLSWFPAAWAYKDSYAIKPDMQVFDEHPEWILRDAGGSLLYIPFACSGGTCPQFAADVGNPAFRNWWIAELRATLAAGYRGVWIDDVNMEWRISDGNGDFVNPINPRTNQPMTLGEWRQDLAGFLEQIRAELPDIEIAHNIIWYAIPSDDPQILRGFAAADYLNLERGITDRGIRNGSGRFGFETFLALVDRAHAMGTKVIMDDDDDVSVAARDYELGFYFLINTGDDLLGADGDRSRMNPDSFWSGYQTNLGAAVGDRYRWNGLFRRDFECGVVLVNQPDSPTVNADLGETLQNLQGQNVSSVSILAANAEVLTRQCATTPQPNSPTDVRAQ